MPRAPNPSLRQRLLEMSARDQRVRRELVDDGSLETGVYHPRMAAVHAENAAGLEAILDGVGWPGRDLVEADGAEAAWLIVQHAIGQPALMRRSLGLVQSAVAAGAAPAWQAAYLEDRIRTFEGKPQRFGTQFEPGEDGMPRPCAIEDPDRVNERRRSVGLSTLEERTLELQREARREGAPAPPNRAEYEAWLREVGWRR